MRLFDTPGADAAYDRWLDPPDIHEDDSCKACHKAHIQDHVVAKNALEWPEQYPCCVDAFEEMKEVGEVCLKHPTSYFEKGTKDIPFYCEGCEEMPNAVD